MNTDSLSAWVRPLGRAVLATWLAGAGAGSQAAPWSVKVTDAQGQPLGDAVVAVFVTGTATAATPGTRAEMAQKGRAFVPTVLAVQTGTEVLFPNLDKVRHHVYSFSPAKTFELKLYGGEVAPAVVFDKPGTVVLGCNIHDRMLGYVYVVDTPYFVRTGEQGLARLELPVGTHRAQVWHPTLADGAAQPVAAVPVPEPGSGDLVIKLTTPGGAGR